MTRATRTPIVPTSAFVAEPSVEVGGRLRVVRAEGRPVRAELLVRAGRHRPARPERRRQDHADARPSPGSPTSTRARCASAVVTRGATATVHVDRRSGARGRGGAGRPHRPPARALHRRPARRRRPRRAGPRPGHGRACSTPPTGRSAGSARACANAPRWPPRWCATRTCSCSTNRSTAPTRCSGSTSSTCSRSSPPQGRTVIVSSHVLNEVERMADRVIVLVHGRLAAAGGHRAIRDAMDDRPRHVLVRASDLRPLAAALIGLPCVAGVTVDAARRRSGDRDRAGPRAGDVTPAAGARRLRSASTRSVPSTTRSRACSASWSDDATQSCRHRAAAVAARGDHPLHPAVVPATAAVGAVLLPCVGAVLFGLMSRALNGPLDHRFANVAAEAIFSLTMPITALDHRRRGARRRGALRHVPLHVAVAGAHLADRRRPLARWQCRRRGHRRAGPASLAALVAGAPDERRSRRSSPASPVRSPTSRCSSPSAASPGAPRCGRWRSCSSSSVSSARRSPASPRSRRRGCRARRSSACSTTHRPVSSAWASPKAGVRSCAWPSSRAVCLGSPSGGWGT